MGMKLSSLTNLSTGTLENLNPSAHFVEADVSNGFQLEQFRRNMLKQTVAGCDAIFHLAALARVQPSIKDPRKSHKANVGGTLNMLLLAKRIGVRRFIYSASSSAYGNVSQFPTPETAPADPLSPYGVQKLIGEQYCSVFSHCYGLETVSLRYFNVFGERQSLKGAYCLVMGIFAQRKKARR